MIGISGGSDMADTENMSVRTRVDDDLAGGNLITDSSSECLVVDDDNSSSYDEGNPSVGEEFVSATSVDDNDQSGHTAEQSGLDLLCILQSLHTNGDFNNMPDTVSNAIISIMVDTTK
ncbi:hypothetical protein ACJMK2_006513 [Sinanodonta woodiana]|uniref:Uncharacterized protein n=1 Tax=Sinanodonta woodiana TaxID=1069815 RepID=A0ABD3VW65_SINWO